MGGLKPKSNPLEIRARPQGVQTQPQLRVRAAWSFLLPQGHGQRRLAADRLQEARAKGSQFQAAVMAVLAGLAFPSLSAWYGHWKRYCCDRSCACAGAACPSCSTQTSHVFTLWPCVHLVPPALATAAQRRLLRADPYICDSVLINSIGGGRGLTFALPFLLLFLVQYLYQLY